MTRRSNKSSGRGGGAGGTYKGPRLCDWQRDRVFRINNGWVPVKRCALCGLTCHRDQAGDWHEHAIARRDGVTLSSGWRWYCGLQCLREGVETGETFMDRREDQGLLDHGVLTETVCQPQTSVPAAPPPPPPSEPRPRIDWADDVEEDGSGSTELRFGDFPSLSAR